MSVGISGERAGRVLGHLPTDRPRHHRQRDHHDTPSQCREEHDESQEMAQPGNDGRASMSGHQG
jgi:hypothetical protein